MIVKNSTKRLIPFPGPRGLLKLIPGNNDIPNDTSFDSVSAKRLIAAGWIVVPKVEDGKKPPEFSSMKRADALSIVEETFDKATLEGFYASTKDTTVKSAIKARLEEIAKIEADAQKPGNEGKE